MVLLTEAAKPSRYRLRSSLARLQLAALVILLTEQSLDAPGTLARIVELTEHPKIVEAVGGQP